MEVGGQHHATAALPPVKTRYPLCKRLGRPQGRSGRVRKISPPPGFDPRTVQSVASRYTDCAIPAADNTARVTANHNTVLKGVSVHRLSLARGEGGAISGLECI